MSIFLLLNLVLLGLGFASESIIQAVEIIWVSLNSKYVQLMKSSLMSEPGLNNNSCIQLVKLKKNSSLVSSPGTFYSNGWIEANANK